MQGTRGRIQGNYLEGAGDPDTAIEYAYDVEYQVDKDGDIHWDATVTNGDWKKRIRDSASMPAGVEDHHIRGRVVADIERHLDDLRRP